TKYIKLPNGKHVLTSRATPEQIRQAARATPGILSDGWTVNAKGQIVKKTSSSSGEKAQAEETSTEVKEGATWGRTQMDLLQNAEDKLNRDSDQEEYNLHVSGGNTGLGRLGDDLNTAV